MTKAELIRRVQALEEAAAAPAGKGQQPPGDGRLLHELQVHQVELEAQNQELCVARSSLESSHDRYADLYDFAPVGYLTLDDRGIIRELNLTAAGMLGVERTRLVGAPFGRHVAREDLPALRQHLDALASAKQQQTVELHLPRNRAEALPVMMQSVRIYDAERKIHLCRAALTDLTLRQRTEAALRESADLNRAILSSLSAHIAVLDGAGKIIAVNEAWSRFGSENGTGASSGGGIGADYLRICRESCGPDGEDFREALDGIQAVLDRSVPTFIHEYPCDSPTARRWFLMTVTPLATAGAGVVISHLDITARRQSKLALAENEARLGAILDTAAEGIITIDEQGLIESFNLAAEKLFGYAAAEVIGRNVSLLMPSPDREAHDGYLARYRETGERRIIGVGREVMGRRKDGSSFPIDLSVGEAKPGGRRVFTGIIRDISARKATEAALHASQRSLRMLSRALEQSPVSVLITEPSGEIIYVNPKFTEVTGYSQAEVLGKSPRLLKSGKQPPEFYRDLWATITAGRDWRGEFHNRRKNGELFWESAVVAPIHDEHGTLTHFVALKLDITERKRAETALREGEERLRMVLEAAAMGTFELNLVSGEAQWNDVEFELLGLKPRDVPASPDTFFRFVHPDDLGRLRAKWDEALRSGVLDAEFRIVRADGGGRWLAGKGRFVGVGETEVEGPAAGRPSLRFLGVNYDITTRKQAEELLGIQRDLAVELTRAKTFDAAMAALLDAAIRLPGFDCGGIYVANEPTGELVLTRHRGLSEAFVRRVGRYQAETPQARLVRAGRLVYATMEELPLKSDPAIAKEGIRTLAVLPLRDDGKVVGALNVASHRESAVSASARVALESLTALVEGVIALIGAETAQRESEHRERRRAAELAALLDAAPTPIFIAHDPDCLSITGNRAANRLLGLGPGGEASLSAPATRRPRHFRGVKDGRQLTTDELPAQRAARGHPVRDFEFSLMFEDGTSREMLANGTTLRDDAGKPRGAVLVMVEITERKRAEAALIEANEFGRQIIGGAQAGIMVFEREGRVVVWNPFLEQLTGYGAAEVIGQRAGETFPFLRDGQFRAMFDRALAGEVFDAADIPYDLPRTGKRGWTFARFAPWRNAQREIVGVIVTLRDITERRRLEAELLEAADREQQRIGHDLHDGLGQRLTALEMGCFLHQENLKAADLTARRAKLREEAERLGRELRECIGATRGIVRDLAPVILQTEGLVGALAQLARRTAQAGRVQCRFVCRHPVTVADAQIEKHLYRIAQEAVNNALKHANARRIYVTLARDPGQLRLQIKDDGRGLPKKPKAGAGMGREIMRHRAHVIGATLKIESKPRQGVRITCTLPQEEP